MSLPPYGGSGGRVDGLIYKLFAICSIFYYYYIKHDSFPRNYTMLTEGTDMSNFARLYLSY